MAQGQALTPIDVIPAGDVTGECVLWDARRQALWWTDIQRSRLYRHDWTTRRSQVFHTPERVGSFGFVAGSDQLITAFASGIALYEPVSRELRWLARPTADMPQVRFNDGRVDRCGRFWAGTMMEGSPKLPLGQLYSFDCRRGLHLHFGGIKISNGLCMSRDGAKLYFADSGTQLIQVHELAEPTGTLGPPQPFARCTDAAVPDGAAIDAEGFLWSAQWGGSRLVRYAPDGRVDLTIAVPTLQPTCVCFGGPDFDLLFVTTAREHLDAATLRREPNAGDVFVYRTGFRGLPEEAYRP